MDDPFILTTNGVNNLKKEHEKLSARLATLQTLARHRDSAVLDSDNAGIILSERWQLQNRLQQIEHVLQQSRKAVPPQRNGESITFGDSVVLKRGNTTLTYTLVGPAEADPLNGTVSVQSPLGAALIGKRLEQTVTIKKPRGGTVKYTVQSITQASDLPDDE